MPTLRPLGYARLKEKASGGRKGQKVLKGMDEPCCSRKAKQKWLRTGPWMWHLGGQWRTLRDSVSRRLKRRQRLTLDSKGNAGIGTSVVGYFMKLRGNRRRRQGCSLRRQQGQVKRRFEHVNGPLRRRSVKTSEALGKQSVESSLGLERRGNW